MKDWQRSPEPPGMMGTHNEAYSHLQSNWGPPEEPVLSDADDFDPAAPLAGRTPQHLLPQPQSDLQHPTFANPALSLYTMCQRVILRNLISVQDLGDMPWRNAKPILEACRVDQLIALEEASPHLLEHSEEIWRRNCLSDFLELRKLYGEGQAKKEPKSWRRLYFKTQGRIEKAKVEAAQRIKDKYAQHKAEKESKRLVVSDRPLMKVRTPANGSRKFGAGASASKGQSLLNKARSGSAAQAKLTERTHRPLGRMQVAAAELAPASRTVRPMVAPKRISATVTDGLLKMREIVKPIETDDASSAPPTKQRATTQQIVPPEPSRTERRNIDFFGKASSSPTTQVSVRGVKRPHTPSVQSPPMSPSAARGVVVTRVQHQPSPRASPGATVGEAIEVRDHGHEPPAKVPKPAGGAHPPADSRQFPSPRPAHAAVNGTNKSSASAASISSIFAPASSRGRASMLSPGPSSAKSSQHTFGHRRP